ncbi:hypothetical protein P175DRAFT_0532762 [Aspergillus ochraceoroseus IBT 24754]|uniref:Uncharacterized protein n=2 Tax=Aspergillus ochraceoroseus TaxID=138278 RepID=A0A2T5LU70_9EURO|nr:uncharacterized protein P175DRAFT_0532762 [Aspergillus ochraceoroseus IBT 24754]KKK23335.1 hypothetical protein AOCH_004130 [Aspergillus ochraceoroseus]PTU19820.1 hypothetical protein P175DRAFT_0532762 [Aspergillus ochraceoroseus IBT 24754]
MLEELEHPSTAATPAILSSSYPSTTLAPVTKENSSQPYNDHPLFRSETPDVVLTQSSDTLSSPQPEKQHLPRGSFHRRANTEIIRPRAARPPSRQLFADQSPTFEDLDYTRTRPTPPTENFARRKFEVGAKLLSDLFQGKSDQVNFGLLHRSGDRNSVAMAPTSANNNQGAQEYHTPSYTSATSTTRGQKRMTAPSPLKQVTSTSPFSFFGIKRQGDNRLDLPEPAEDELLNLDIAAALFPPGMRDLDDQEAFDALRNNAENVIRRLQAAYKQRTFALHEALGEKTEKQEELEETRTRIGHLKVQLDGMAEKVLRQDKAMKTMAEELEQERQLRQREEDARQRSVMLIRASGDDDSSSELAMELQTPKWRFKRVSNGTLPSDSGFDSGDESLAESVFSRREGVESPTSTIAASPNFSQITLPTPPSATLQPNPKELKPLPTPQTRQSTYDKVLKGLASTGITTAWGNSSRCGICHGVPASEAWSVMGILKEENKGLKTRLGELEMVIDDCLSLVGP